MSEEWIVVTPERRPGPTDYLFDWVTWLNGDEQARFSAEYEQARAAGTGDDLSQLLVIWHNRAMQRKARQRRLEREDEGGIG